MNEDIIAYIERETIKEIEKINSDAISDANEKYKNITSSFKEKAIFDEKVEIEEETSRLIRVTSSLAIKNSQKIEEAKREIIDEVIDRVTNYFDNLEKESLLKVVSGLIKSENLKGSYLLTCSKKDFDKYKASLCSKNLNCDKLTDLPKSVEINLSKDFNNNIKRGFGLISDYYDISFSFDELIDSKRDEIDKLLGETLFK
ncbi:MAG: hypothetical protein LBV58_03805 [Acholeplasmatales bacterium]|jgi:vacuolar-type H+-ATPase subunit E/Vma4|nr:hypothetical protein [Acholeplasmatales bacterium]